MLAFRPWQVSVKALETVLTQGQGKVTNMLTSSAFLSPPYHLFTSKYPGNAVFLVLWTGNNKLQTLGMYVPNYQYPVESGNRASTVWRLGLPQPAVIKLRGAEAPTKAGVQAF